MPTDYTDFHRLYYTFLHEMMIIMIISDKELSIYRAFSRACARTKMFIFAAIAAMLQKSLTYSVLQYGNNMAATAVNGDLTKN